MFFGRTNGCNQLNGELNEKGVAGHNNAKYLDQKKFWVLRECSEALGVSIYLHITDSHWSRKIYEQHPELRLWSWGVETATHALRIIASGVFDAFSKATLILGHLGESLPYLLGRINQRTSTVSKSEKLKKPLSHYIKENIVITTSSRYNPEALVCAVHALGADRILFAADYPYLTPKEAVGLIENTPISDWEKEQIYHLNAERWLKLQ